MLQCVAAISSTTSTHTSAALAKCTKEKMAGDAAAMNGYLIRHICAILVSSLSGR